VATLIDASVLMAAERGGRVATRDLRSFPRIPGLEMVEW
jgi:predicted nucleic acid-binding protein